jgi:hypothetical protein
MKNLITLDLYFDRAPTIGDLLPNPHGSPLEVMDYKALSSHWYPAACLHETKYRVWLRAVAREDAR